MPTDDRSMQTVPSPFVFNRDSLFDDASSMLSLGAALSWVPPTRGLGLRSVLTVSPPLDSTLSPTETLVSPKVVVPAGLSAPRFDDESSEMLVIAVCVVHQLLIGHVY